MAKAIKSENTGVATETNEGEDVGAFLCEYMGYKVTWYQEDHTKSTLFAGFVHVGMKVTAKQGETTVKVMLKVLLAELKVKQK
jgi:pyrrolidone-carboxylate peptidase